MASRSQNLRVVISGDASQLSRVFAKAEKDGQKFGKATEKMHAHVSTSFGSMAKHAVGAGTAAVGAYASIATAKNAIDTTVELAHSTLTLSKNFGLTVKTASEWGAVARSRGIDGKALTMGFKALSTQTHAATEGGKGQIKAFRELGISHADLTSHGNDLNFMLHRVSDGLAKMPAGTDRAALSAKLFGRTWTGIAPLIRGGSKAMDDQLKLADKYGVTFAGKTVKSLEDLIKAQRESKFATMGLQVAFGTMLAPALTKGITAVNKFVLGARNGTGAGGKFAQTVRTIIGAVRPFGSLLLTVGQLLVKYPAFIAPVGAALIGMKIASFATSFKALNVVMKENPFIAVATLVIAVGTALYTAYKSSKTFRDIVGKLFTAIKVGIGYALTPLIWALDLIAGGASTMLHVMGNVPGFGWANDAADAIDKARKATRDFVAKLREVPKEKKVDVVVSFKHKGLLGDVQNFLGVGIAPGAAGVAPKVHHRARGGMVPGHGNGDIVPAMLEPGEFVVRRKVVDRFGPTFFARLNNAKGYTSGGIVARANAIDARHYPYVWGGGHARTGVPDGGTGRDPGTGYDCSGAVSAALNVSPRVSGAFTGWGLPGAGAPNDTKVFANAEHVWAVFNGRGWGTSHENPGGGAGWLSYNYRPGFAIRHLNDGSAKARAVTGNKRESPHGGTTRGPAAGRSSSSSAGSSGSGVSAPSAYELALSGSDVRLAQAAGTTTTTDDVTANTARAGLISGRLAKVNQALAGLHGSSGHLRLDRHGRVIKAKKMSARDLARKKALLDEKASLTGDLNSIGGTLHDLTTPVDTGAGSAGSGDTTDPNQPLIDALNNAAQVAADQAQAQKDLKTALSEQLAFAQSVAATENYSLSKSLADIVSGQIAGYGVAGLALTPGSGVKARY